MFTNPLKNLKLFGLREDMIVADLGAGTGTYSLLLSQMVPLGKVYAVEVQRDFVETITNKAKAEKCKNLDCLWGDIEKIGGTKIGNNIVDAVVASNVFFQLANKDGFVKEVKRILKPGGKLLLIDWKPESALVSKTTRDLFTVGKVQSLFEKNEFKLFRIVDTGHHHYGIILIKN